MTELEYVLKHGGLTPKRLLQKITRRGFGMSVLGGLAGVAASHSHEYAFGSDSITPHKSTCGSGP